LKCNPKIVEQLHLNRRDDGEFTDCPQSLISAGFDVSDRKFVALAKISDATVINAVDSDWIEHADLLGQENVSIRNICGCDKNNWFLD
jgi:hypothetical protein